MSLSIKKKAIKKAVSVVTTIATVVCMSGVAGVASLAVADTVADGALIKSNATNPDGTPTFSSLDVYIVKLVGTKQFKRLVLNPTVFNSYGHLNWEDIQTVSQSVMDSYTTSGLVRVDTDPDEKVYALAPDGDVGAKSWVNLTASEFLGVAGSEDGDSIYTINSTDSGYYTAVGNVTTVTQLGTFYSAGTLPDAVTGELTVSLSATTPASSTLVQGQASAHLADFVLTGSGTVTGVTLARIGVSQDSTLSNVYLFDGATRLTDAASVSSGNVNFTSTSGLFTVSGSKIISVKSDIAGSTAGETVGIQLTGVTLGSGSANGVPVAGNTHSIASATLAGVAVGAPLPSSAATTDPTNDVRIWESVLSVTTRDVVFSKLALRQINSIETADIENFRLLVDGTEVATQANLDTNGYVTFSGFTKTLTSGNRTVKVLANVIGGSSRIVQMSLRNKADIDVLDSQYGVNVAVTGTIPASTSTLTVNSGTITVQKSTDSPSGDITNAASNQVLGKYTFTAYGEAIKVETLTPGFTYTNTGAGYTAPVVATTTLTVAAAPADAEIITIGQCVVTFIDGAGAGADNTGYATEEIDCSDNVAEIGIITVANPGVALTAAQVSAVIDTLTSVTDATQGALTLTAGAANTTVFTAPAALTGSITFTDGTTNDVTDVATAGVTQVGTLNAAATLRNGMILVDGAQVGSTTTLAPAGTAFTTNFVVAPGTPVTVEVRADLFDNDGTGVLNTNDTILAFLTTGSSNGSRQVSLGTVNVPTAQQNANQVTVATGSMTLASTASYPAQTTVVPQSAYKVGSWSLSGSSAEDININTLSLDVDEVTGTTFSEADLTDMYITYDGNTTSIKSTASAIDNDWSVNYVLAKNASVTIELYASIGSTITASHSVKTDLTITGTGADSTTSISEADKNGQTITYQAGSITATRDASTANAVIVDDSGEVTTASYKFEAVYDNYTISEVVVAVSNASAVANVILKDGATVIATKPGATAVTFSGLSVPVTNNSSKVLDVYVELSAVGVGAGTSGSAVTTDYTSAKAIAGSTGIEATVTDSTVTGNAMYVYKAIPTITNVDLPSGVLGAGTKTIAKFTVASSGGTIAWKELMFTITKNGAAGKAAVASPTLWDVTSGSAVQVTAAALFQNGDVVAADCSALNTSCELVMTVGTKADDDAEEQVSGSKTYEVRATVSGTIADNDYVNTNIGQNSAFVTSAVFTSVDNSAAAANVTFAWSDVSAQSHDTGTADWTSDYLVKNLATNTQNLVK